MRKLLSAILLVLSVSTSVEAKLDRQKLRKGFVSLQKTFMLYKCNMSTRICTERGRARSVASGFIVRKTKRYDFIMTAKHFCQGRVRRDLVPASLKRARVRYSFSGTFWGGELQKMQVYATDIVRDICLLRTQRTRYPPLLLAKKMIRQDGVAYSVSSPLGIFSGKIVPILKGRFFGRRRVGPWKIDHYTIPAQSGSSGSPIVSPSGKVVGILIMVVTKFNVISLAIPLVDIKDFMSITDPDNLRKIVDQIKERSLRSR